MKDLQGRFTAHKQAGWMDTICNLSSWVGLARLAVSYYVLRTTYMSWLAR